MSKSAFGDFSISIHALREEGDATRRAYCLIAEPISIHALREEGDRDIFQYIAGLTIFLSTPSARRATYTEWYKSKGGTISIHALREEGDIEVKRADFRQDGISIHALREEGDRFSCGSLCIQRIFLSTPSARRATLL